MGGGGTSVGGTAVGTAVGGIGVDGTRVAIGRRVGAFVEVER